MEFKILPFLLLLLSIKSTYTRESSYHQQRVYKRATAETYPVDDCMNKTEGELRPSLEVTLSGEDIIPCNYNPHVSPTEGNSDNVEVAFIIFKIRDVDEYNQDYILEVNFHVFWEDKRLRKILLPEGKTYIPIDPKLLPKLWSPDIIIDNVKDVSQPFLLTKPYSLRMYSNSIVRYSSRMTITMACNMDFLYYPADTQRCNICLRSFDYRNINLTWRSKPDAIRIASGSTQMSSYDVKVASIKSEVLDGDKVGKVFRAATFDVLFKRNLNYHLIQTFFPSTIFVVISWLGFLVPLENVAARMTLCTTTLLTLATMFAVVRQSTPNESYAKALDVWMITCVSFVFGTLVEYTALLKLMSIKVRIKKNDDDDDLEEDGPLTYWKGFNLVLKSLNFVFLKKTFEEMETQGITTISYGPIRSSSEKESAGQENLRTKYRGSNQGSAQEMTPSDSQGRYCRRSSSSGPSTSIIKPTPQFLKPPASFNFGYYDKEKLKDLALHIERFCTICFPSSFLFFNVVFWPTLLIQSGHFSIPSAN